MASAAEAEAGAAAAAEAQETAALVEMRAFLEEADRELESSAAALAHARTHFQNLLEYFCEDPGLDVGKSCG